MSKHVALVGELSRLVERGKLLEVGEVEQGLATGSGADFNVSESINIPRIICYFVLIFRWAVIERTSRHQESKYSCME